MRDGYGSGEKDTILHAQWQSSLLENTILSARKGGGGNFRVQKGGKTFSTFPSFRSSSSI